MSGLPKTIVFGESIADCSLVCNTPTFDPPKPPAETKPRRNIGITVFGAVRATPPPTLSRAMSRLLHRGHRGHDGDRCWLVRACSRSRLRLREPRATSRTCRRSSLRIGRTSRNEAATATARTAALRCGGFVPAQGGGPGRGSATGGGRHERESRRSSAPSPRPVPRAVTIR